MIYIAPDWMRRIAEEVDRKNKLSPYFPTVVIRDLELMTEFLRPVFKFKRIGVYTRKRISPFIFL